MAIKTPTTQMEFLVVSGQAAIRLNIERELKRLKFKVKTASSGKEAIKLSKTMLSSLIIVDSGLPDMPVLRLLQEVNKYWALMRDVVEFDKPKAIVIAKANEKLDEMSLRKFGVLAKLQKPVNLKTLVLFVNKIIQGQVKAEEGKVYRVGIMDPESRSRDYPY
jgi:DNA-binding response OmpR family regulator